MQRTMYYTKEFNALKKFFVNTYKNTFRRNYVQQILWWQRLWLQRKHEQRLRMWRLRLDNYPYFVALQLWLPY